MLSRLRTGLLMVQTLYSQVTPTSYETGSNSSDTVVGVIFTLSEPASLTGIWFYSVSTAGDLPGKCGIFDMTTTSFVSGTENTSPSWSGAAGSGWVKCSYNGSAVLQANHNYIAAVAGPDGTGLPVWLTYNSSYSFPETTGIITAPVSVGTMYNGPYNSSPGNGTFDYPSSTSSGYNWWVDVEVIPQSTGLLLTCL